MNSTPPPNALDAVTMALALAKVPCGLAILGADQRYRWANPAHLALTGRELSELCALPYRGITDPDDLDTELNALASLHAGRCEVVSWRRRFGREGGVRRWCGVTAHAQRDSDHALQAMIWIVEPDPSTDGSVTAALESALRRMRSDHEQVAALLSHDAVQPTRMISSYAGLIEQHLRGGRASPDLGHVASIQRASDELRELLRETVSYLRVPDRLDSLTPVFLRQCTERVVARLALKTPGLSFRVTTDIELKFENEQVERCLHAALIFAWARSQSGLVEVNGIFHSQWAEIVVNAPDAVLCEGDNERIFRLGARIIKPDRTEPLFPGLAVARRIVQSTGGEVEVVGDDAGVHLRLRFGLAQQRKQGMTGNTAECNSPSVPIMRTDTENQ